LWREVRTNSHAHDSGGLLRDDLLPLGALHQYRGAAATARDVISATRTGH